jgi:hypothetical protein
LRTGGGIEYSLRSRTDTAHGIIASSEEVRSNMKLSLTTAPAPKAALDRIEADRTTRARRSPPRLRIVAIEILAAVLALFASPAAGEEVWSGRDYYFEKEDYADWTLEANQDRITDQVWITRKSGQGIFNIAQEDGYQYLHSPQDTEWATGDAVDWATLTFRTWEAWHGGYPPDMVGDDAVVHLISEDVYIDIRFEGWTIGGQGGGFSYYRAAGSPTPVDATSWGRIRTLYR